MWKKKKEWRALRALVLDEVSMLPASLLDEFDKEVRQIRGNTEQCFGGIQLIFVGDLCKSLILNVFFIWSKINQSNKSARFLWL